MDVKTRREEIKKLIEEKGIFSLNFSELGRKYGVSHTTIHEDVDKIMGDMPSINWVAILNKSQSELEHTIKVVSNAMEAAKDGATKSRLASQLSEMVLRKMQLLEKMDKLLPASMKPEPVTICYKCIDKQPKKESIEEVD